MRSFQRLLNKDLSADCDTVVRGLLERLRGPYDVRRVLTLHAVPRTAMETLGGSVMEQQRRRSMSCNWDNHITQL